MLADEGLKRWTMRVALNGLVDFFQAQPCWIHSLILSKNVTRRYTKNVRSV